jgi:hypothetical protein
MRWSPAAPPVCQTPLPARIHSTPPGFNDTLPAGRARFRIGTLTFARAAVFCALLSAGFALLLLLLDGLGEVLDHGHAHVNLPRCYCALSTAGLRFGHGCNDLTSIEIHDEVGD